MSLQVNKENNVLEVHQFHYTVWPDHGVPECGTPLLSFHSRVEKFFKRGEAPMVIHCSAGVGRTGTFIVIDTQMQRIKHQSNIDIFNNVRSLRYSRNYMVQTQVKRCIQTCYGSSFNCDNFRVSTTSFMVSCWRPSCVEIHHSGPQYRILSIVCVIWLLWIKTLRKICSQNSLRLVSLFFEAQKVYTVHTQMLHSDVLQERKFTYNTALTSENAAKNRYQNHLAG